jgi:methylmalonyl-CoA/ethylmalonyl-CoA epimerase
MLPASVNSLPRVKLLNLDHVGIAVHDLDEALNGYRERYRVEPLYRETVESQGVEEAMIPVGGSYLQLLSPLGPDTLAHLAAEGARLVDETARAGSRGTRIAFVHPADLAGTLIELVELSDDV